MYIYKQQRTGIVLAVIALFLVVGMIFGVAAYLVVNSSQNISTFPVAVNPVPTARSIRGGIGDTIQGKLTRSAGSFEIQLTGKQIMPDNSGYKPHYLVAVGITLKNTSPVGVKTDFDGKSLTRTSAFSLSDEDRLYSINDTAQRQDLAFRGNPLAPGDSLTGTLYFEFDNFPSKPLMLRYWGDGSKNAQAVFDL